MAGTVSNVGVDYIYNGQGYGAVADLLLGMDELDFGMLRPWRGKNGKDYVTNNRGQNLVTNTPALMPYLGWLKIDKSVQDVSLPTLRVMGDLINEGLTYDLEDALGTPQLLEQTMGDAGNAVVSMDALKPAPRDRPVLDTKTTPIPIFHAEISFPARILRASRRAGLPLDTTMFRKSARKISELAEGMAIGTSPSYSYGGGTLYGLLNRPERLTYSMTLPTAAGWEPSVFIDEILEMVDALQNLNSAYNGPYGMYYSPAWSKYLGKDYSATYSGTLRTRLREMMDDSEIRWMRKLRYGMSGFRVCIFQLDTDVIRVIRGTPMITLQWDGKGGLAKNFLMMMISPTEARKDPNNESGIVDGLAA